MLHLNKWSGGLLIFGALFAMGRVAPFWLNLRKDVTTAAALLTYNTCNILFAIGLMAVIEPIYLSPSVVKFEIPAMAIFSAAILAVVRCGQRISRRQGILMLCGYVIFVVILLFHFS